VLSMRRDVDAGAQVRRGTSISYKVAISTPPSPILTDELFRILEYAR
jgi:hypothetical protein